MLIALSIVLVRYRGWAEWVVRVVDIPEAEYPKWLQKNRLFIHRTTLFQWMFASAVLATGVVWVVDGSGVAR